MKYYIVFDPQKLLTLANKYKDTFKALGLIEKDLNERFVEMEDPILALILAVASGESLLFKGPPGTAKSWLVRAFCRYIRTDPAQSGQTKSDDGLSIDYFEYLLTPFTEPGELFGYFDIGKLYDSKELERDTRGMMQNAKIVYLDEVFKGSSAILNSLLAFINERIFHDRGKQIPVELQCLFGATNEVPYTSELRAIYDRFLLRCDIINIAARPHLLQDLLNKGWRETYGQHSYETSTELIERLLAKHEGTDQLNQKTFTELLKRLADFRQKIDKLLAEAKADPITDKRSAFLGELNRHIDAIRKHGLSEMSNRRIIKFLRVMMIHSIYDSFNDPKRAETLKEHGIRFSDKEIGLWRFMLDRRDEIAEERLKSEQ